MKPLALTFDLSVVKLSGLPSPLRPEIALLGRSNVGKSSLLNCVAGREGLARTSKTPGRTQALNFYNAKNYIIVDLPGYGYAKVPDSVRRTWKGLIEGYLTRRESLVAGVHILDIRHDPSELDIIMSRWLVRRGIKVLAVATKSDKLGRGKVARSLHKIQSVLELDSFSVLPFSAKTGDGKKELIRWIETQGKA